MKKTVPGLAWRPTVAKSDGSRLDQSVLRREPLREPKYDLVEPAVAGFVMGAPPATKVKRDTRPPLNPSDAATRQAWPSVGFGRPPSKPVDVPSIEPRPISYDVLASERKLRRRRRRMEEAQHADATRGERLTFRAVPGAIVNPLPSDHQSSTVGKGPVSPARPDRDLNPRWEITKPSAPSAIINGAGTVRSRTAAWAPEPDQRRPLDPRDPNLDGASAHAFARAPRAGVVVDDVVDERSALEVRFEAIESAVPALPFPRQARLDPFAAESEAEGDRLLLDVRHEAVRPSTDRIAPFPRAETLRLAGSGPATSPPRWSDLHPNAEPVLLRVGGPVILPEHAPTWYGQLKAAEAPNIAPTAYSPTVDAVLPRARAAVFNPVPDRDANDPFATPVDGRAAPGPGQYRPEHGRGLADGGGLGAVDFGLASGRDSDGTPTVDSRQALEIVYAGVEPSPTAFTIPRGPGRAAASPRSDDGAPPSPTRYAIRWDAVEATAPGGVIPTAVAPASPKADRPQTLLDVNLAAVERRAPSAVIGHAGSVESPVARDRRAYSPDDSALRLRASSAVVPAAGSVPVVRWKPVDPVPGVGDYDLARGGVGEAAPAAIIPTEARWAVATADDRDPLAVAEADAARRPHVPVARVESGPSLGRGTDEVTLGDLLWRAGEAAEVPGPGRYSPTLVGVLPHARAAIMGTEGRHGPPPARDNRPFDLRDFLFGPEETPVYGARSAERAALAESNASVQLTDLIFGDEARAAQLESARARRNQRGRAAVDRLRAAAAARTASRTDNKVREAPRRVRLRDNSRPLPPIQGAKEAMTTLTSA